MARARKPINAPKRVSSELKTIGVIAAIVAVGVVYWWAKRDDNGEAEKAAEGAGGVAYALSQPAHGPAEAPAVLVKFTDFQ